MSRFVLDCAVSRPVDAEVAQWLGMAASRGWAHPSGGYHEAKISAALLQEAARSVAATAAGAGASFTADQASAVAQAVSELAVRGGFEAVVTSATDPVIVQESTALVAQQVGVQHVVAEVDGRGRVGDLPARAILVTSAVNQEIGTVQRDLHAWADQTGSAIVLEATSALGWVDLPDRWDRMVLDPRAWGAPAGAVAVVSRDAVRPRPFDNVPAAVVAGLTAQRWMQAAGSARSVARRQVRALIEGVRSRTPDVDVQGGEPEDAPHILSISVLHVDAEAVQTRLDAMGYAVGSGSACASRSGQPSHVLAAIGGLTSGNVRVGLPPGLPDEVITGFVDAFAEVVAQVRAEMGTEDL